MHILVVEDETKVASFIKRGLQAANYSVDVEHDGAAGTIEPRQPPARVEPGGHDCDLNKIVF